MALLIAAGLALAAADAVKYAMAVFTPIVLIVVALAAWQRCPGRAWLAAPLTVFGAWLVPVLVAVVGGGHDYWHGITTTTLTRPQSDAAVSLVLKDAYNVGTSPLYRFWPCLARSWPSAANRARGFPAGC